MLVSPLRNKAQLRERAATSRALLADKALLEQELGRLTAANARLEGEKVALQAALGAQEEAGRRNRAQHEAQLQVARRELRELEEHMARVRAAMEL